jgi:hypothetical protein
MQLKPTNGHIVAGTRIDQTRLAGRVKAAQLFQIAPDPRATEDRKKLDASREVQELYDFRQDVQGLFEGQKKKNSRAFSATRGYASPCAAERALRGWMQASRPTVLGRRRALRVPAIHKSRA